jgi:DNA topoisomerase-3
VDVETARAMVAAGETNAAPAAPAEPLGPCPTPGCGGEIIERGKSYGCTSWKSRTNAGCGFVIWKREKGHDVSREEAVARLAEANAAREADAGAPKVPAPVS